jgi:hypothetical protein
MKQNSFIKERRELFLKLKENLVSKLSSKKIEIILPNKVKIESDCFKINPTPSLPPFYKIN